MQHAITFSGMLAAVLAAMPAAAGGWDTQAELGAVRTGGNTSTQSLHAKLKTAYSTGRWVHTVRGSAVNNSTSGTTSAERYAASFRSDYKVSNFDYIFGRYAFDTDRFSGYKSRHSGSLGYGHYFLRDEIWQWKGEIGAGARQTRYIPAPTDNEVVGRAATYLKWKISDSATFIQHLETEGGKKGWVSNSVSALKNKINGNLSSKIALNLQHNSNAPAGKKKLDSELAVTFVYAFPGTDGH